MFRGLGFNLSERTTLASLASRDRLGSSLAIVHHPPSNQGGCPPEGILEHHVLTSHGPISVAVYGDLEKPALVTYPDVALNPAPLDAMLTCLFQSLDLSFTTVFINYQICHAFKGCFFVRKLLLCCFIISAYTILVLQVMRLETVMCFGVTAGAYILTLFATKYREHVLGLILVSPLCKAPSWSEWLYMKVVSNLLYFYGMCGLVKEYLLQRYFSKEVRGSSQVPESDIVQACRSLLDEKQSANVWWFLQSINGRHDLTEALKKLQCRTLIFVGEDSPFHSEALHMSAKLDKRYSALVEVQGCGSVVTEEQPHAMLIPMEYFLMGYGLYRPSQLSYSPRSPLSPLCISPELLSPESMGVKLKPIKTRIPAEV
ncbi:hypothetical protein C4D60_Mb07t19890 [Musa balbisiana]|uniref:Pollen-specific protein SF21 n=1 Tax=Musa balbisiana TaxID=52838 RepID=A0A4S8JGJ9_MUSBA|nr:hypothetical protein C4D60_Mb07t19890 [Musa balbisiana]